MQDRKLELIVDDTPTNVAVVSGVLKDSFRTKVATNGEKALAIAMGPERPDLILLDVMMPGMDGYEVCRRLKDNLATRDVPVIFLTAKTDEVDEEKGFDVGAVDYIHKPFSAPIVMARVRTQLALQEALTEARDARKQADQLLHALLPKKAADEIRSIGTVIPRRYENVAVLFCDVTNFTAYCDKHEPEDVVSRLDALFVIFERITAKHGLEKIKTIGDGFMAVAGLLHQVDDPVGSAVRCGLEMIEARWLFDIEMARVGVVVHPQSIVHSMVEFVDGSLLAQLSTPDMCLPIQYALTYPDRAVSERVQTDFPKVGSLTFEEPDLERFPSLELARRAGEVGGTLPAVLNAANEVAVEAFVKRKINFPQITDTVRRTMDAHRVVSHPTLEQILEADAWARTSAAIP